MPIDVSVKRSPGWWLQRLFNQLNAPERRARIVRLRNYRLGDPPLPEGAANAREAFAAFQRKARSNFAELIVSAMSERMMPVGFRTARDQDVTGDAEVGDLWERAGLDVACSNVHDDMLSLSEAYIIVGNPDEETGAPQITAEDPLWTFGERNPSDKRRLLAALKVLLDDAEGEYRAYLYLPGSATNSGSAEVWVARRPYSAGGAIISDIAFRPSPASAVAFGPSGWDWVPDRSGALSHTRLPVVRFDNKDDLGEYETHIDLLDRINHQILQRMTIATLQAFRQRAVKGLPLTDPVTEEEIDYSRVFTAHPAAIWQLPETAEMWESGQVDLSPILAAVKDDVQHLSAVTKTPMHLLAPDSANQSAEGASFAREGLVFKVDDRIKRTSYPWARVMSLALLQVGMADRADLAKLRTIWAPPERLSLAEKASADAQAQNTIPRRSRLIHIWGFSPAEADRIMTEVADEQLLQLQLAQASAAASVAAPTAAAGPTAGNASAPGAGQANQAGQQQGQQPPSAA